MPISMSMSANGRHSLELREGKELKAYRDTKGVLTIGIGHTSMAGPPEVTPDLVITDAECDAIFARDLAKYEATVNKALNRPIPQDSFDACVSLCYNIGQGGFAGSTVVRRINEGDLKGAAEAFLLWDKPPEIIPRRKSERQQFLAGLETATHVAPPITAAPTVDPVHAPAPASAAPSLPPLVQAVPAPPAGPGKAAPKVLTPGNIWFAKLAGLTGLASGAIIIGQDWLVRAFHHITHLFGG